MLVRYSETRMTTCIKAKSFKTEKAKYNFMSTNKIAIIYIFCETDKLQELFKDMLKFLGLDNRDALLVTL